LIADTGLNEKTLSRAMADLQGQGLLVFTGDRCGRSGRTKIYRLVVTEIQQEADSNPPKSGGIEGADTSEKLSTDTTKNGGIGKSDTPKCGGIITGDTTKNGGIGKSDTPKCGGIITGDTTKNGGIEYPQKRGSESLELELKIKDKNYPPQCNTAAVARWLEHMEKRHGRTFLPHEMPSMINLIISLGNHQEQLETIEYCISSRWKNIHPKPRGGTHGANRQNRADVFANGTAAAFSGENW
jgi:hypothetical protein